MKPELTQQLAPTVVSALGFVPNSEQVAAIQAPFDRTSLISAGAGSGKTTVMAARALWAVSSGYVAADRVLGLTFTSKAANELNARMSRMIGQYHGVDHDDPDLPSVSTYHAFAHQLVAEYGAYIGLSSGLSLLNDYETVDLACQFVRYLDRDVSSIGRSVASVAQAVIALDGRCTENAVSTARLRDHSCQLTHAVGQLSKTVSRDRDLVRVGEMRSVVAELVDEFRDFKRKEGLADFNDLLRFADELSHNGHVRTRVRDQWQMVMLDEYQDTSVVQGSFLARLFGDGHPVTAVGDPLQAIYGWRGASAGSMSDFGYLFAAPDRAVAQYSLSVSQRCAPEVLSAANAISAPVRSELCSVGRDPLRAANPQQRGTVIAANFDTMAAEVEWLAGEVATLVSSGYRPNDIAVLCRTSTIMSAVTAALRRNEIAHCAAGNAGILDLPEIRQVVSMLTAVGRNDANVALLEILAGPRYRLGPRDLALLGRRAKAIARAHRQEATQAGRGLINPALDSPMLLEAVEDPGPVGEFPFSDEAQHRLAQLRAELSAIRRHAGESLVDLIDFVISLTALEVQVELAADDQLCRALLELQRMAARFGSLHGGGLGAFVAWLHDIELSGAGPTLDPTPAPGEVIVMTIHKAKGLEWDVVFVPGMAQGAFPAAKGPPKWTADPLTIPHELRRDRSSLPTFRGFGTRAHEEFAQSMTLHHDAEERRLGYVACTRARVRLLCSGHWWGPTQLRPRGPSRHLLDVREVCDSPESSGSLWCGQASPENPQLSRQLSTWPPASLCQGEAFAADTIDLRHDELTHDESAQLAAIDDDIDSLAEFTELVALPKTTPTPRRVSVSELLSGERPDADGGLQRLRGIAFHSWVANRWGQQILFDSTDDLTDAAVRAVDISDLIHRFERSQFANRVPEAVEEKFTVAMNGVVVAGRIDAVFRDADRWQIVDWKTGSDRYDEAQLILYRRAWALVADIAEDDIDCYFVNVSTGEIAQVATTQGRQPQRSDHSLQQRSPEPTLALW